MPGVSISSAPLGSVSRSRVTVVWRPRPPLCSLTSPIAWRSKPSSALTSVDLPAPDGPSRTLVVCGSSSAASGDDRVLVVDAHRDAVGEPEAARHRARARRRRPDRGRPSSARARRARRRRRPARRSARSGARWARGTARRRARARRSRPAPGSSTGAPAARRTTVPRRSSTAAMTPSPSSATQSPVVGVRSPAARMRPRAATSRGGAVAAVGDEPAAAVLGEHAGGGVRGIAELARARRRDPVAARWRRMGHAR